MENTSSPSSSSSKSAHQESPSYVETSAEQSLFFSDSLKGLKNLRSQLYSAAEYFELSYTNDDHKQMVVNTLKDYAVKALVNTVDHLGSVSYKVNSYFDEKADEVSGIEIRVSCIEQRVQTCQDHVNHQGLSQQTLVITAPKYHKRYVLPVGDPLPESGRRALAVSQETNKPAEDFESKEFQNAVRSTITDKRPSLRKTRSSLPSFQATSTSHAPKLRFPSPSPQHGKVYPTEKRRSVSPLPTSNPLMRSGALSNGHAVPSSSPIRRRHPWEPQKSMSMRLHAERSGDAKLLERSSSRTGAFLKSLLLRRRRSKNDEMLNAYLDEY